LRSDGVAKVPAMAVAAATAIAGTFATPSDLN